MLFIKNRGMRYKEIIEELTSKKFWNLYVNLIFVTDVCSRTKKKPGMLIRIIAIDILK